MFGLEQGYSHSNVMTLQVKYNSLYEEFLSVADSCINEGILKVLKEYYTPQIDSNRKLSQIKDLRTLLKVLEKRDYLSYNNVEPLFYISINFLNDLKIESKIRDYKFHLQNTQTFPLINMYQSKDANKNKKETDISNVIKSDISQSKIPTNDSKYQTSQSNVESCRTVLEQKAILQQTLLLQISERIGRSWRDTARYLNIPEYQIDAIQNKYPSDLREQSFEALKLYVSQYDTGNWELNLIRALEKARRRDLKELAEKFIINNGKD
ncbi:fas-associated death domain protein isoform X1 [Osmia lignaria lignaria]|uniref:fas-associated death domain protein isoform X1 n=1 Tax=Osmia lignaria lignaria TaxID=1437193 RepID=UPI00402B941B